MTKVAGKRNTWWLIGLIALICIAAFPYFERLNNPNEHVRLYMTMAIVEEGTFAINGPTERFGWVNDRALREGQLYAGKAPGASFLGVPAYALLSWLSEEPPSRARALRFLRLLAVTLPSLIFLFFLRRFFDELPGSPWLHDVVLVAYGLGSMALAYGLMFAGHQLAAVCLGGAFIAGYGAGKQIAHERGGVLWRALLAGLLLGAAPAMEYPAALGAALVGLYLLLVLRRRPLALILMLAASLPPVALLLGYHWVAFGSPFAFPYDFIENPAFQRLLNTGWHGSTLPRGDRLLAILFAPNFGLLFLTPLLLLAPLGWLAFRRAWSSEPPHRRHLYWVTLSVPTLLVLYLASSALWRAGWAVGPRYIASALPFACIAAVWGGHFLTTKLPRLGPILVGALTLLSLVHAGSSGLLYPHQPEPFDNPVYDLNIPLIVHGFSPHTVFDHVGVFGHGALALLALLLLPAILWVLGGQRPPWRRRLTDALAMLALCAVVMLLASHLGEPSPDEERMWSLVVRTWEPRGHSAPEQRLARLERLDDERALTLEELEAAAAEAELLGRQRESSRYRRRARSMRTEEQNRRDGIEGNQLLLPSLSENPGWGAEE